MLKPLPVTEKRYLKPSLFWSIRQGFPAWLRLLLTTLALFIPLLVWSCLSYSGWISPLFLPTPIAVLQAGIYMLTQENLLWDILASCLRVGAGFIAAAFVGIPIGIAMGTFQSMESLFSPIVGTVRYLPITAFVPLIILWVGLGEESKVVIIFLGIVFFNAIMIADAVRFIPNEILSAAYTLGATRWDVLLGVILPATLPNVLDTLRVNVAGAWNYLVIAELIAAENGLGYKIVKAQRFLQTDQVLVGIVMIGLIGLLLDFAFRFATRLIVPWAEAD